MTLVIHDCLRCFLLDSWNEDRQNVMRADHDCGHRRSEIDEEPRGHGVLQSAQPIERFDGLRFPASWASVTSPIKILDEGGRA
jgi:hypothetical protein